VEEVAELFVELGGGFFAGMAGVPEFVDTSPHLRTAEAVVLEVGDELLDEGVLVVQLGRGIVKHNLEDCWEALGE
jgi:hypothetical protein